MIPELEEILAVYPDGELIVRPRWWNEAKAYLCERYDGEKNDASVMMKTYWPTGYDSETDEPVYLGFREERK